MSYINLHIAIVGGGAAGLFAGAFLKQAGEDFLIIERGTPGRKLLRTGHSRCNITNRKIPKELKNGYHEAGNFIYPAISKFTPEDTIKFLEEELNIPLKEEENNKIFPKSDKASEVLEKLVSYIGKDKIVTDTEVVKIRKKEKFVIRTGRGDDYVSDILIIATGGASFSSTGSDGSGYKLAMDMGHEITPLRPSIAPFVFDGENRARIAGLQGITIKNARVDLYKDNKKIATNTGDLLFTHKGISGPGPMGVSREIPLDIKDTFLVIDYVQDLSENDITRLINDNPQTKVVNLLSPYIAKAVIEGILGENKDIFAKDIRKEQRKNLIENLKRQKISIMQPPAIETATVTRGGVCLKEIDRSTMRSKITPGLYILGETLDIDGISGGYNLQAAVSTANLAVADVIQSSD